MTSNALVQKLWNFCNVLRDDGVSTIEYVEQLTDLLFLKMADERARVGLRSVVPEGLDWPSLLARDGDDLEVHYRHVLEELGRRAGTLGTTYRKAQNRIQDPATWLRDEALEDGDNLPEPAALVAEIAEELESALVQLRELAALLPEASASA